MLVLFATLIVLGLDTPAVCEERRLATPGRLLLALITTGGAIGALLTYGGKIPDPGRTGTRAPN